MFIRRQDLLDRFDSHFQPSGDGGMLFQPDDGKVGLPVDLETYEEVTLAYEAAQKRAMIVSWIALFAAMAYGLRAVFLDDSYASFFGALGLSTVFAFSVQSKAGLDLLMPLVEARKAYLEERAEPDLRPAPVRAIPFSRKN